VNIGIAIAMLATRNMNPQNSPSPELIDDRKRLQLLEPHTAKGRERRHAGLLLGGGGPGCKPRRCTGRLPRGVSSLQASPQSSSLALRGNAR